MPIPVFHLYGEPQTESAARLLHIEPLAARSRPANWTIQPHLHSELHHVILISSGGGTIAAEARHIDFRAPCLIFMPAGVLHGFDWHRESRGLVLTIGDARLAALSSLDPDIATLFSSARAITVDADATALVQRFRQMAGLLAAPAPGSRSRVEALLLLTLADGIGRAGLAGADATAPARQIHLVERLRARIDQRFHLRESVASHAAALGSSETALRLACQAVAGMAPAAMLDRRALLEAQRLLLNTSLAVAAVAEATGFADPAYFTRFFKRHTGVTPRAFRRAYPADQMAFSASTRSVRSQPKPPSASGTRPKWP